MTLSKNIHRGFKNDIRIAKEMVQHATQYATQGTAYLLNIIFDDIKKHYGERGIKVLYRIL